MPPQLTSEESSYVKLFIILPLILSAFERDKRIMESALKTPKPYVTLLNNAIKQVEGEHKEVRRKFRLHGLKVYEERHSELGIEAKYLCRGYHYNMSLSWSLIKAESTVLMEKFLGLDIFKYISPSVPGAKDAFELPSDKEKSPAST
jgi:hypothetical protein